MAVGPSPDHPNDDDICIICLNELEHPKVCSNCFWPVCSSECGRSNRHKMECATLAACARESEDDLLPLRHLLVMRCLQMKHKDQYSWEKLLDMEVGGLDFQLALLIVIYSTGIREVVN